MTGRSSASVDEPPIPPVPGERHGGARAGERAGRPEPVSVREPARRGGDTGGPAGAGGPGPAGAHGREGVDGGEARAVTASGGRRMQIPPRPRPLVWPEPTTDELYEPEQVDFNDLIEINRALAASRARLWRLNRQLAKAGQMVVDAELAYDAELNRQLVSQSGGSAEQRRAAAELMCEGLHGTLLVARRLEANVKNTLSVAREDLDGLIVQAHNLRAQIAIER